MTNEFETVSGHVETAIDQIHSTRARAEEATDIQKNRFEYFDMFMQSLKQSQATIDSRIGFLYTIGKISSIQINRVNVVLSIISWLIKQGKVRDFFQTIK